MLAQEAARYAARHLILLVWHLKGTTGLNELLVTPATVCCVSKDSSKRRGRSTQWRRATGASSFTLPANAHEASHVSRSTIAGADCLAQPGRVCLSGALARIGYGG